MSKHLRRVSSVTLAFATAAALPGPVWSLTAAELWEDWQETMALMGTTLSAQQSDARDGALVLDGVTMTQRLQVGGETSKSLTRIGEVTLVEQADGSVRVEVPSGATITSTASVAGDTTTSEMTMTHEGLDTVARDEDGVRVYDSAAASVTLTVADVTDGAAEVPVPLTVTMRDLASTYRVGETTPDAYSQTLEAGRFEVGVDSSPVDGGARFLYAITNLAGVVSGTLPTEPPGEGEVMNPFTMGMTYDAALTHDGTEMSVDAKGSRPAANWAARGGSGSGAFRFALDGASLTYDIGAVDSTLRVEAPALPAPVDLSVASSRTALTIPFATGEARDVALDLAYRDVVVDDAVWSLFDPTGQLPRGPATLVVSLEGTADVNVDLFGDPSAMATAQEMPARPVSLTLTDVLLRVAGAELTGSGTLGFPPRGPVMPEGSIDLALDGGMTLVDRLAAVGIVPPGAAMMARAMAGSFARSVGEDRLETTVEFTRDGGILANGERLR